MQNFSQIFKLWRNVDRIEFFFFFGFEFYSKEEQRGLKWILNINDECTERMYSKWFKAEAKLKFLWRIYKIYWFTVCHCMESKVQSLLEYVDEMRWDDLDRSVLSCRTRRVQGMRIRPRSTWDPDFF